MDYIVNEFFVTVEILVKLLPFLRLPARGQPPNFQKSCLHMNCIQVLNMAAFQERMQKKRDIHGAK
jgi:hypothetical protein